MKILWSPSLSEFNSLLNLPGPNILRGLRDDDLNSYCVARLLDEDTQLFQPGPIAAITRRITFSDDEVPKVDRDILRDLTRVTFLIRALERIYEANEEALVALLHEPGCFPSDVVASYAGVFRTPAMEVQVHQDLVDCLHEIVDSLPGAQPNAPFFLTGSPMLGRLYLEAQPCLSAQSTLALLATSGIAVALPRVAATHVDDLASAYDRLRDEREAFLATLNMIVSEAWEALKAGDHAEAYRFAAFHVARKLEGEAIEVERAMRKLDSNLAKRLGLVAIEGIPSIARAFSSSEGSWMTEAGIQILSILCNSLAQDWRARELSEKFRLGSYAYRIRRDPSLAKARTDE